MQQDVDNIQARAFMQQVMLMPQKCQVTIISRKTQTNNLTLTFNGISIVQSSTINILGVNANQNSIEPGTQNQHQSQSCALINLLMPQCLSPIHKAQADSIKYFTHAQLDECSSKISRNSTPSRYCTTHNCYSKNNPKHLSPKLLVHNVCHL